MHENKPYFDINHTINLFGNNKTAHKYDEYKDATRYTK
jgi:CDGSH-type Zn-finger protein